MTGGVTGPEDPGGVIGVLIADDEAPIRAGFKALVDSAGDLRVVGEAADGLAAVRQSRALRPDVVLRDIRMPGMDGLEAEGHPGRRSAASPRLFVVTTFDEDEHVFEVLRSGASGFVLKDTRPEELLEAIRVVAAGESLLAPNVIRRLIAEFARGPRPVRPESGRLAQPTSRELEVLGQVAAGRSNAEIAASLHLSLPTIKTHVSRLLGQS